MTDDPEPLLVTGNKPPVTVSGHRGCVMLHKSGQGTDSQWFDYRPGYYQDIVRIEWDLNTMDILLPVDAAEMLIKHAWAREMTSEEATAYNNKLKKTEVAEPPRKPKKETKDD